jgi:hypothetical protein
LAESGFITAGEQEYCKNAAERVDAGTHDQKKSRLDMTTGRPHNRRSPLILTSWGSFGVRMSFKTINAKRLLAITLNRKPI